MMRAIVAGALASLLLSVAGPLSATEVVDDFAAGGWKASNPKAPAKVTMAKGKLVLQDLPGGQVTWGSSAAKAFRDVDIKATPYIVFDLAKVERGFACKLTGGKGRPKKGVCQTGKPGLVVVDIPGRTGWKPGKGRLTVMVYTQGDGTSIELRSVKITGTLTDAEKAAMAAAPKAAVRVVRRSGLTALDARHGMKPLDVDAKAGERTVYVDPATGHEIWRMTDHPAIERHVYYDILAWNANGGTLLFLSRRAGGNTWLMDADGSNIRPLPQASDGGPVKAPHWSPTNPNILYFARPETNCVRVMSLDARSGAVKQVTSVPIGGDLDGRRFSELPPPHPDERHFLLRWGGQDRHKTMLVVVDSKTGKFWKIEPGLPTHRVRFTKHADLSVFINCNMDPDKPGVRARTEWVLSLDGAKRRMPPGGGHPDWTPDGAWFGAYRDGGIELISHDCKTTRTLTKTGAGGHGGFCITTGAHHVGDSPNSGPYANLVYVTEMGTGHVFPIAFHGSSYSGWSSGVPDPEATHPAPICSPDETKIVYDSDMLGDPDVWVAVWKRPGRPRDVALAGGVLSWKPPVLHREIAGYNVFRKQDGLWTQVKALVRDTRLAGLADGQYAVSAQERSGLESLYATAGANAPTTDNLAPARPAGPRVVKAEMAHVVLQWPASTDPDLDHYNVYAAPEPDDGPSLATLVGSPKVGRFVDWGLKPGTTYHYRITAVDRQGNQSLPSPAAKATTSGDAYKPVRIELEAELGKLEAPMVVARDKAASGGAYVHVPDSYSDAKYVDEGKLTLTFDIPQDGTYDFWGRGMGPNGESNSFFVSLDGLPKLNWGVPAPRRGRGKPRLTWLRVSGLEGAPLKKGKHVLVIATREDGACVDKIVITNEPDGKPGK